MDYRSTLNLPHTAFPMRANLPEREPERLRRWQTQALYRQLRRQRSGAARFVLHDGPPYANGDIHMGTTLNKVLKDIINRYHWLLGEDVVYVPGYDTHGLPIEMQALKSLGVTQHQLDPVALREVSAKTARHFMAAMNEQFQRLGVLGDWDRVYATLDPDFEAEELRLFAALVERGLVYKDLKPVHWCPVCETALAEAELEYRPRTSHSIWVAFEVADDPDRVLTPGVSVLIWTTTPWTLPANVAVAYHPDLVYQMVDSPRGRLLVASALVETVARETGLSLHPVGDPIPGHRLAHVVARHPWLSRPAPLVAGAHVTAEAGTGLVHTAPGHGQEDFEVGRAFGLPVLQPLDDRGRFDPDVPLVGGLAYEEANAVVIEALTERGRLVHQGFLEHAYAHCWRCKNPIIFRATRQWFLDIQRLKPELLAQVEQVVWVPAWGHERMQQMIVDRQDWCLSRQRSWGLPIPAFTCGDCGEAVLPAPFIRQLADLVALHGSTIWWTWDMAQLTAGVDLTCPHCGSAHLEREFNVFDVWFDSGAAQAAVLASRADMGRPADVVLEGGDQFRGWFNSLLTLGVARYQDAPYRTVVTHGWVLDAEGRPMHKSLGNVIDPFGLVDEFGADVLRLWVAGSDFRADVRVSREHLRQVGELYRKLRNTFRFCLGNLADYDLGGTTAPRSVDALDAWALRRLAEVLGELDADYAAFDFHGVVQTLNRFCTVDLSSFYLDVVKDRLYTLASDSALRRGTQDTLWWITSALARAMAPILPFTAEEVWEVLPGADGSVFAAVWPRLPAGLDVEAGGQVDAVLGMREPAQQALEALRQARVIGNSLEADLMVTAPGPLAERLAPLAAAMAEWLLVARVEVRPGAELRVEAQRTTGQKCARCWRYVEALTDDGVCERCRDVLALGASRL